MKKPERWVAHAFPSHGVKATQHLYETTVPGKSRAQLYITLYEVEVPDGASACEAPWQFEPAVSQPCVVEGQSPDVRMVTVEYGSAVRTMQLVTDNWVLAVSGYGRMEKNTVVGSTPLRKPQQRALLMAIAERLDPEIAQSSEERAARHYTVAGSPVSLQLPPSWDVRDGAFDDGSLYFHDTTTDDAQQLFLQPHGSEYEARGDLQCKVLASTRFDSPDDPGKERIVQAVVEDSRAAVGKATLLMYVADAPRNAIPCGAGRGVSNGNSTVTLTNSLQFDTPEVAAAWVASDDYRAVAKVMKSLRVTQ